MATCMMLFFGKDDMRSSQDDDSADKVEAAKLNRAREFGGPRAGRKGSEFFFREIRRNPFKRLKTSASFPHFFAFFPPFFASFPLLRMRKNAKKGDFLRRRPPATG